MEANPNEKVSHVYSGLVQVQSNGLLNWTGTIKTLPERLDQPGKWREPRAIFVCSQSDLFHKEVPDEFIGRVFGVMRTHAHHTYYVLTKRPERLLQLLEQPPAGLEGFNSVNFPNVIVGVSAENQAAAEERLPLLVQVPIDSSHLFVSAEPLIGPLDLSAWINRIGYVIVGGESGKRARPMHPSWALSLRDQCVDADIAFHFKQHGEWTSERPSVTPIMVTEQGTELYRAGRDLTRATYETCTLLGTTLYRVGRRMAGRILDDQYWNARPGADRGPCTAPHPLGREVRISTQDSYHGLVVVVTAILPDDPENSEFEGEEAVYYVTVGGTEIEQAFSYWQLKPTQPHGEEGIEQVVSQHGLLCHLSAHVSTSEVFPPERSRCIEVCLERLGVTVSLLAYVGLAHPPMTVPAALRHLVEVATSYEGEPDFDTWNAANDEGDFQELLGREVAEGLYRYSRETCQELTRVLGKDLYQKLVEIVEGR
jgi:protein gp37